MKNIDILLNKEQKEAVMHKDGPLLILAGAGSGKTRVITYRVAYLISEYKIPPENILAVTFTNKAADEMKSRIKNVVGKAADKIWISTFHSMGCRILREHAEKIGYTKNFTIYDEDDRERLVKNCMSICKVSEKQIKPYIIIDKIQDNKNELISADEYKKNYAVGWESKIFADIFLLYEEKLKRNNAVDFDDLIIKPIEIFEKFPEVLSFYREKFRYILIDEYQDINNSQYVLISMIAQKYKNICVVGDDDQSIYKFRGADITNILSFEDDYPNAKVIRLEQNYRSTKIILKAAHSVIKNNMSRKEKELWTENKTGDKIKFYNANDENDEADYVVENIFNLIRSEDIKLKDIAVFYRMNAQSRVIEDKLRRAGIPYRLVGGIQFYGRMEIKDLLAYLRIISNPYDTLSFKRIINIPPRGIGDATIDRLEKFGFENNLMMYDVLFKIDEIREIKDNQRKSLENLREFIKELNEIKNKIKMQDLIKEIINRTGYLNYWESDTDPNSKERVENIKELVSAIADYEMNNPDKKIEDFLNQASLISEIDRWDKEANAVTLMTIHSAKGLEFDVVFIIGMDENIFPHKNCLEEENGIEEERRLCYVGITRAKRKLFLLSAVTRRQYGTKKFTNVSRFIKEIPQEILVMEGKTPPSLIRNKEVETIYEKTDDAENTNYNDFECEYKPGQIVKHIKMGIGKIEKVEPYGDDIRLTVIFRNKGKRTLSAKYAKFETVD